jgi:hypothetical protein
MRGVNQHTKMKFKKKTVDDLIQNALDNPLSDLPGELQGLDQPEPEDAQEMEEASNWAGQFIPKPGNQPAASLRRRLQQLYGHKDNPSVALLINGVVRFYSLQKKATNPDVILKLWSAIRQSLLNLEQITGRLKGDRQQTQLNPYETMSDEELTRREVELASILGFKIIRLPSSNGPKDQ